MNADQALTVGVGTLGGGALTLALARMMFARLLAQFDAVVAKVALLDVAQVQTATRLEAIDERTVRNGEEIARMGARLDAAQMRIDGISSSHGPRLAALEATAGAKPS